MPARAPTKRETWLDWMPNVPATMSAAEFVQYTNAHLDTGATITEGDLETWQDDGILPAPVEIPSTPEPRYGYPPMAWRLIANLVHWEIPGEPEEDPEFARQVLRGEAAALNTAGGRTENSQTWRDYMPENAPMPALLSHDELLGALRARGIDLPSSTLEYYRQQGLLPRPIRRRHGGATRPVYPEWMVGVIEHLRNLQDQGFSLEEIKPHMRMWLLGAAASRRPDNAAVTALENAVRQAIRDVESLRDLPSATKVTIALTDPEGKELYRHEAPLTPDALRE